MLGPEYPVVKKIRNYYHNNIILKIEQKASIQQAKTILNNIIEDLQQQKDFRSTRIILDVDPV